MNCVSGYACNGMYYMNCVSGYAAIECITVEREKNKQIWCTLLQRHRFSKCAHFTLICM